MIDLNILQSMSRISINKARWLLFFYFRVAFEHFEIKHHFLGSRVSGENWLKIKSKPANQF